MAHESLQRLLIVIKNLLLEIWSNDSDSWPLLNLFFGPHRAEFPAAAQDFKMTAQRMTAEVEEEPISAPRDEIPSEVSVFENYDLEWRLDIWTHFTFHMKENIEL